MIKAICFDLFFTLIIPSYEKENNEYDILGLSAEEWERYAENASLYRERALGYVKSEREIIEKITASMPCEISDEQKQSLLKARENRMKNALQNVPDEITGAIKVLKAKGKQIGLISNADRIDCKYWEKSKLFPFFDDAVFSCEAGLLKPDRRIYELAMRRLGVRPGECVFVGDGGSDELRGAKEAGMKTVFTEALEAKSDKSRKHILQYSDYHIRNFAELAVWIGL